MSSGACGKGSGPVRLPLHWPWPAFMKRNPACRTFDPSQSSHPRISKPCELVPGVIPRIQHRPPSGLKLAARHALSRGFYDRGRGRRIPDILRRYQRDARVLDGFIPQGVTWSIPSRTSRVTSRLARMLAPIPAFTNALMAPRRLPATPQSPGKPTGYQV